MEFSDYRKIDHWRRAFIQTGFSQATTVYLNSNEVSKSWVGYVAVIVGTCLGCCMGIVERFWGLVGIEKDEKRIFP